MAWVTWRQHRHQLLIGLALIVFLALAALVTGLPMRTAYQREALSSCLPPTARSGCDIIVRHFQSEFGSRVDIARYLILLPALVGMFVGAPLLARELEHGTHRFAWTQSVTRRRWLLSKTLLLALAVTLSAVVLSAIVTWWRQPFDGLEGRMSPSGFEIQGLVVPAYALFALTLGVLAGAALRRSLAAMSLTLAAFVAVRLAVATFLRPRYEAPEHETMAGLVPGAHARDWVLSNSLVDAVGRHISRATGGHRHPARPASSDRPAGVPALARLASRPLVPSAGSVLDVQAIESGDLLPVRGRTPRCDGWLLQRSPS
jgi:hypothetical protein